MTNWKSCEEIITLEIQKTLCIFSLHLSHNLSLQCYYILFVCVCVCVCVLLLCILLDNDTISTVRRSFRNIKIKVLWGRKNIIFWLRYCCLVTKSCPTFCEPMHCILPGSSVYRISLTRIVEWVAISFSRGSSQPRNQTDRKSVV